MKIISLTFLCWRKEKCFSFYGENAKYETFGKNDARIPKKETYPRYLFHNFLSHFTKRDVSL